MPGSIQRLSSSTPHGVPFPDSILAFSQPPCQGCNGLSCRRVNGNSAEVELDFRRLKLKLEFLGTPTTSPSSFTYQVFFLNLKIFHSALAHHTEEGILEKSRSSQWPSVQNSVCLGLPQGCRQVRRSNGHTQTISSQMICKPRQWWRRYPWKRKSSCSRFCYCVNK